eukprot:TRINITY_DN28907_c0_g1_i1.p1 TRINITY_DN28907_c0_g1~~TRINITY_DN28907_c0_g1_i1.p1  ORF type:complete len:299 (-),score=-2.57 TRINITY_DN28907_c0_g1_i1:84-980(-)
MQVRRGYPNKSTIGDYLNPVNGHRGALQKKGVTPKDYMKENLRQLRESQRNNRDVVHENEIEPENLYKLSQFQNVPSRVFEESKKLPYREPSSNFLRKGEIDKRKEELGFEARMMRNELERKLKAESDRNNTTPPSPRKPPVFHEVAKCAPKNNRNFISENRIEALYPTGMSNSQKAVQSKNENNHKKTSKHDEYGRVPAYLENRKQQWAEEEEYRRLNAPDPDCPRGMMLMPENERVETLNTLKNSLAEAVKQLSSMPFVLETPSLKRKHAMLEEKIKEIENAIGLFSRQKVYIAKD